MEPDFGPDSPTWPIVRSSSTSTPNRNRARYLLRFRRQVHLSARLTRTRVVSRVVFVQSRRTPPCCSFSVSSRNMIQLFRSGARACQCCSADSCGFIVFGLMLFAFGEGVLYGAYVAVQAGDRGSDGFLPDIFNAVASLVIIIVMVFVFPVVVITTTNNAYIARIISDAAALRSAFDADARNTAARTAADTAFTLEQRAAALAYFAAAQTAASAAAMRVAVGEDADADLCRVCLSSSISPQTPRFRCAHVVCEGCADRISRGPAHRCVCPFCRTPLHEQVVPAGTAASIEGAGAIAIAAAAAAAVIVDAQPRSEEDQLRARLEARIGMRVAAAALPVDLSAFADAAGTAEERDSVSLLRR